LGQQSAERSAPNNPDSRLNKQSTARSIGLEALAMLIGAPEWQEGMAAFMEKREPRFPPLFGKDGKEGSG
jgi:1,4-dihydroxy-2-naphthoyl-CoA synthase